MKLKTLIILLLLFQVACGGGGGNNNSNSALVDNNACDLLPSLRSKNINRIIEGTSCSTSSGPIIRILLLSNDQQFISVCTGTLITQTKVLTAAHCFLDVSTAAATINNKTILGVRVNTHPLYLSKEFADNAFDIAVLELSEAADQPTLPILIGREVTEGEIAGIFGYGQTMIAASENGNTSNELRSGEVIVRDVSDLFYRSEFKDSESNTCFGDSGGPLIVQHLGRTTVAGTTSFGTNLTCDKGDKGAYVRLQEMRTLEFLSQVAGDAEYL